MAEEDCQNASPNNDPIVWASIIRNATPLVQYQSSECSHHSHLMEAVDNTVRGLLNRDASFGWLSYSSVNLWQPTHKDATPLRGLRFHVYQSTESLPNEETTSDDDESDDATNQAPYLLWIFACVYDSSKLTKLQAQSFLEKMVQLTELFRETDDTWRAGNEQACQEEFEPILEQRVKEMNSSESMATKDHDFEYCHQVILQNKKLLQQEKERQQKRRRSIKTPTNGINKTEDTAMAAAVAAVALGSSISNAIATSLPTDEATKHVKERLWAMLSKAGDAARFGLEPSPIQTIECATDNTGENETLVRDGFRKVTCVPDAVPESDDSDHSTANPNETAPDCDSATNENSNLSSFASRIGLGGYLLHSKKAGCPEKVELSADIVAEAAEGTEAAEESCFTKCAEESIGDKSRIGTASQCGKFQGLLHSRNPAKLSIIFKGRSKSTPTLSKANHAKRVSFNKFQPKVASEEFRVLDIAAKKELLLKAEIPF